MKKALEDEHLSMTLDTDLVSRLCDAGDVGRSHEPGVVERHRWLEAMINHVPDYIYAKDTDGRFLFANAAVIRDNGLKKVEDIIGLTDRDLHGEEAAKSITETERRVLDTGNADLGFEERALKGGGWLMMSRVPLKDEAGRVIGVVGASRDISARKQGEILMKAQGQLLHAVARGVSLEDLLQDAVDLIENLAPGVAAAILLLDEADQMPKFFAKSSLAASSSAVDILKRESQTWYHVNVSSGDGNRHGLLAACGDIDAATAEFLAAVAQTIGIAVNRHQDAERIIYLAQHDALTGLPNRLLLDMKLEGLFAKAKQTGHKVAVVFLDLDNFKHVNDSLGHAAGDELLKIVARRICEEVGQEDLVSRVGGDEFVLAFQQTEEDFPQRLSRLQDAICRPLTLAGIQLAPTCSMGTAFFPDHGNAPSDLFANADMAMYHVKENGRNSIQIFNREMAERAASKLFRTEELRRALEREELVLHFQPQLDLVSGETIGVEALVRWNHPTDGLIFPADFIPLAEESGLIVPLGEAILNRACQQAKEWQRQGLSPIKMSVNMSARQFQEPAMLTHVVNALNRSGLDPSWLELEVTESLLMRDVPGAVVKMLELNTLGVSISIDDFGTGYSSLSTLKSFPLSRLKIDRSFIADVPVDARGTAITSAIVSLAHSLQLDVVAEGVETQDQAQFLMAIGCHVMQGYLFSKPLPADEMTLRLQGRVRRSTTTSEKS